MPRGGLWITLVAMSLAASAQASEGEVFVGVAAPLDVAWHGRGPDLGWGGEAIAGYSFYDWLGVQLPIGGYRFARMHQRNGADIERGLTYSALQLTVLPVVRLTPVGRLWPAAFGEYLTLSLDIGAGYRVERRSNQSTTYHGLTLAPVVADWHQTALLAVALGLETRLGAYTVLGARLRYAAALTNPIGYEGDLSLSLTALFAFYP